jgi:antitoxin HicB
MNMSKNPRLGSTLEEFLEAEGKLEEATEYAVKAVIAWQLAEAMKEGGLSKTAMAARLRTSRTQINRILDPANGEVSIATLRKAAEAVGRKLKIELV